jgi:hypothetical protein
VALSAERLKDWMAADLSRLDLLIIQIDGIHIEEDLMLLAAVGIDGGGLKHPLGVLEWATENTAVVQALLDNLIERGLDPAVCRLFVVDGAKALTKAIRNTFGRQTDPALSGPQGPQRHGSSCQASSRQCPKNAAAGVGTE